MPNGYDDRTAESVDLFPYLMNVFHLANGFYTMLIHTDNGVAMKKFEVMK